MVAEHAAKQKVCVVKCGLKYNNNIIIFFIHPVQKRKRPAGDSGGGKAAKKLKEFKF